MSKLGVTFKEFSDAATKWTESIDRPVPVKLCPLCGEFVKEKGIITRYRHCTNFTAHVYSASVFWDYKDVSIHFDIAGSKYTVFYQWVPDLEIWVFKAFSKYATVLYELLRISDQKVLEHVENALHA